MKIKIRPADKLFSLYIRNRDNWTCQRCGKKHEKGSGGLHCSHYWGRGKESTRFDEDNCDAICYGCHSYFHANPEEHRSWKKKQLGDYRFKMLMIRANTYKKKNDKLVIIWCKVMLKEYDTR